MRHKRGALAALVGLVGAIVVVPRAVEAAPTPPAVQLAAPAAGGSAIVSSGGPVTLRLTVDRPVTFRVGYRPSGSGAGFVPFPDATGRGTGTIDVGVVAPAVAGAYDVDVTVEADGVEAHSLAERAIIVTGPALEMDQRCDDLDPAACLLPFPNDAFTGAEPTTDTGRTVNFNALSTPKNVLGKPVDPTEWNRNDGFSPGSMVLTHVPDLDLQATWGSPLDQIQDLASYARPDAPMVLIDAATGAAPPVLERARLVAPPPTPSGSSCCGRRVNLLEGHRYIVALRNLRRADGSVIGASPLFAAYRDRSVLPSPSPEAAARRAHMEAIFGTLESSGITRGDLYLAWDFTVASERNLSERALRIRDDAFASLGDTDLADLDVEGASPTWTITTVTEHPNDDTLRRVEGTITVPNYLTPQVVVDVPEALDALDLPIDTVTLPLSRFNTLGSPDGLPVVNPLQPTVDVSFVCNLPAGAADEPAHPVLYGHGLLGSRGEANGGSTAALRRLGFAPCAVDWWGMSIGDLPNVALMLTDFSYFPTMVDRSQQGFLNFLFLGRALRHPAGLTTDPAFRGPNGQPLLAPDELFYDGNSQGGIMGGALGGARSRSHSGQARGAGHELLDPAQRGRRTGRSRARSPSASPASTRPVPPTPSPTPMPSTPPTRRSSTSSSATPCSRCSGTEARPTATPST